jgi:hypothetical protein
MMTSPKVAVGLAAAAGMTLTAKGGILKALA